MSIMDTKGKKYSVCRDNWVRLCEEEVAIFQPTFEGGEGIFQGKASGHRVIQAEDAVSGNM